MRNTREFFDWLTVKGGHMYHAPPPSINGPAPSPISYSQSHPIRFNSRYIFPLSSSPVLSLTYHLFLRGYTSRTENFSFAPLLIRYTHNYSSLSFRDIFHNSLSVTWIKNIVGFWGRLMQIKWTVPLSILTSFFKIFNIKLFWFQASSKKINFQQCYL